MKIFKELKKLGYIHYSATTIEELDDLPLNSAERISEQALVLRWFREKHNLIGLVDGGYDNSKNIFTYVIWNDFRDDIFDDYYSTYEEAELACLIKLIEIAKRKIYFKIKYLKTKKL